MRTAGELLVLLLEVVMLYCRGALVVATQDLTCDFESDQCPWLRVDRQWEQTDGQHPANSYSPLIDHTLRTNRGHYMYIAMYTSRAGKIMASVNSGPDTTKCFQFHYYLHGPLAEKIVGSIKVTLWAGANLRSEWFSAVGNFRAWQRAHIELPPGVFNLTIEAYLLRYRNDRIVAVDDVKLYSCAHKNRIIGNNKAVPILRCGFESVGICGFTDDDGDIFRWQRRGADEQDSFSFLPLEDVTLRNRSGHYVYAVAPPYEGSAKLFLPLVTLPTYVTYCLNFFYSRKSRDLSTVLFIYAVENKELSVLWSDPKKDTAPSGWTSGVVPLPSQTRQLIIDIRSFPDRMVSLATTSRYYALDDVTVEACPVMKQAPPLKPQNTYPTSVLCDFEAASPCNGSVRSSGASVTWVVREAGFANIPTSSPGSVYFLSAQELKGSDGRVDTPATFLLPEVWPLRKSCIRFNVYMRRKEHCMLQLSVRGELSRFRDTVFWEKTGGKGQWETVMLELSLSKFQLTFIYHRRTSKSSTVALDNVLIADCESMRTSAEKESSSLPYGPPRIEQNGADSYTDLQRSREITDEGNKCTCSRARGVHDSGAITFVILILMRVTRSVL